ncbi:uncharacterized protein LOC136072433 isoform X2 [Hydra vulgaris]|uniref:uncharacterized protein LOC136072433 isoform X2 n=1 Tax=Hydra vulgaris TaxID=6087 RepID=UPI0032EA1769
MDKLKKLEDSVENLKKLEHSMENLENSIAPQAIISGNLFSILMQFYGFYVYLNLIITVFMQLHKCLTYVTLYTFFFTFTIALNHYCHHMQYHQVMCFAYLCSFMSVMCIGT